MSAENMLHLAFRKRLHQIRGVSMLHGVIVRLADLKEYEESERVATRIAAAMTMYIKKGDAALYGEDEHSDDQRLCLSSMNKQKVQMMMVWRSIWRKDKR